MTIQLKIHQPQPNIYTLFWRFDLITRSSSEEAGTQFFKTRKIDEFLTGIMDVRENVFGGK